VTRKQGTEPLTLIVVPHSERAPKSFRLPTWLVPALGIVTMTIFVGMGLLAARAYRLQVQVRALLHDQRIFLEREREMRTTIIAQQSEVQGLSEQVQDFQAELSGVRMLSEQIKGLIGLPGATPTPTESPALLVQPAIPHSRVADRELVALGDDARGGAATTSTTERSMEEAVAKSQDVIDMQVTIPDTLRDLMDLREQVLQRVDRIEPRYRIHADDLEKQLRLLAAAPSLWPVTSRHLSSLFGYRTLLGQFEFHNGIDIPVWYGTKVCATRDGKVVKSGWQAGLGYTVELEHEMGFTTIYGHNSRLLVKVGDDVKAGDVISLSGSTGRSTGPHLHYEMRLDGSVVDPLKYLDSDVPYTLER
jgi:murein DD-endopeptidase MepM/ murein hydrolase activator NlpD